MELEGPLTVNKNLSLGKSGLEQHIKAPCVLRFFVSP